MKQPPPTIVRIESIAHGGDGVASTPAGKRLFVPGTVPGDRVEVETVERRAQHDRGRVLRVLEAGPARVEPRCVHADRCGGCQLQQLAYEGQLAAKEEAFYDALARLGGWPRERIPDARPIVPSPQPFGYRIRCRLAVQGDELGYLGRRSHELVPLQACHLLVPALEALALRLRDALRERPIRHLAAVELCVGDDGRGAACLEPRPGAPSSWARRAGQLLEVEGLHGVVALAPRVRERQRRTGPPGRAGQPPTIFGEPVVSREAPWAPGVRLLGRPDVFAQANAAANEALVAVAVEGLDAREGDEVLELFCGAGNFTFALATRGARVTAVEMEGASIDLARRAHLAAGGEGRVRFISGDAGRVAEGFAQEGRRFDRLLLDPPRAGARGVLEAVAALGPRRIAYVSCDPATLARDLRILSEAGYRPRLACPVDMFPQTYHVEGVVVLEREGGAAR